MNNISFNPYFNTFDNFGSGILSITNKDVYLHIRSNIQTKITFISWFNIWNGAGNIEVSRQTKLFIESQIKTQNK